jgi:TnpA family transposase
MANKEFISQQARKRFEEPPQLSETERSSLLMIPPWAKLAIGQVPSPTNKAGFILQLGYFRLMGRFFHPKTYPSKDIDFIVQKFSGDPNEVDIDEYKTSTYHRHREIILQGFGFKAYTSDGSIHENLLDEATRMARNQTKPSLMFDNLVAYLWEKRTEIPTYYQLKTIIQKALETVEKELNDILKRHLTPQDILLLDNLFQKSPLTKIGSGVVKYDLTLFKKIPESMENQEILKRVEMFIQIKAMYEQLLPVIKRLNLSHTTIRYYAEYVIDTQTAQLKNNLSQRNLWLIAFIIHQYFSLGDALILTFQKAVKMALHGSENRQQGNYWNTKPVRTKLTATVSFRGISHAEMLTEIERISNEILLTAEIKIAQIQELYRQKKIDKNTLSLDIERIKELQELNSSTQNNDDYYKELEKVSFRLQLKLSGMLEYLQFSMQNTNHPLLKSITYFQENKANIIQKKDLPIDFLSMDEQQKIYSDQGKLKVSLYKMLLFKQIQEHLKSGELHVENSYNYQAYTHFLIPMDKWEKHREGYLQKAGIAHFKDAGKTLLDINETLNRQFERVNQNLPLNPFISIDSQGKWKTHKPQEDEFGKEQKQRLTKLLYPPERSVPILRVLSQVNQLSNYLSFFQHHSPLMNPKRPPERLFYAALIGYGENIGILPMGNISENIDKNALDTVATHYFDADTLLEVNDYIVGLTNQLPLEDLFRRVSGFVHTSSDGMKVNVSGPCLRASESYKYFGNGKGVVIYSHLDEAGQLTFSTVFSADEPESAHLLNGLTHNELLMPDAHSTDDHGHSLPCFAITYFIGIDLRPRIANLKHKELFSIDAVSTYKEKGYKIVPNERVNIDNIIEHWDDILRVVCSIKLGHTQASDLFRRLNSYDRQNPLYKALSDLGRLLRTIYILRYIDDPEIRASVEEVLANGEHGNAFARAVIGSEDYRWLTQREQLTAEGCKRLIMNIINYYNHLLMLQILDSCATVSEQKENLKLILQTNTHTWSHINLKGSFDFGKKDEELLFDLDRLSKIKLSR